MHIRPIFGDVLEEHEETNHISLGPSTTTKDMHKHVNNILRGTDIPHREGSEWQGKELAIPRGQCNKTSLIPDHILLGGKPEFYQMNELHS